MTDPLADPEKFEKMCAGKDRYTSESAASAALKILRKQKVLRHAETMNAYQCDFCDGYHFGH